MIENVIKVFTVKFSLFRSVELPAKLPFVATANAKQQGSLFLGEASNSYKCITNWTEEMHSGQVKFASLLPSGTNNQKLIETEPTVDKNRFLKGTMYYCVSDLFFKLSENSYLIIHYSVCNTKGIVRFLNHNKPVKNKCSSISIGVLTIIYRIILMKIP